jgi:hypothetical protein
MLKDDLIDKCQRAWRVAAVTPAGHKYNLEILKKYIYRDMDTGLIDEWQLWLNTDVPEDVDYIYQLEKECDKVRVCTLPEKMGHYVPAIANYFKFANHLNTIYIRFDDDICFIQDGAVKKLAEARLQNSWVNDPVLDYVLGTGSTPEPFVICANIVNNFAVSAYHHDIGALGESAGRQSPALLDGTFCSADFFELTHETFKTKLESGKLSDYYFPDAVLSQYQPFSINCFAFFAKDLMFLTDLNDEPYIWGRGARKLGRPNMIKGDALVVHRAYGAQRGNITEEAQAEWLDFYKRLSETPSAVIPS